MKLLSQKEYADALAAGGACPGNTDSMLRGAVMSAIESLKPTATNVPTGADVDPLTTSDIHPADKKITSKLIQKVHSSSGGGNITLIFIGETHTSTADQTRAQTLMDAMIADPFAPGLIVLERGLKYTAANYNDTVAYETNLTTPKAVPSLGLGLSRRQRSVAVAGYIFLYLAGGDQSTHDRAAIFYGENHTDIVSEFEYFAQHTTVDWVKKRPRYNIILKSQVK